jgi:hypothetical protein
MTSAHEPTIRGKRLIWVIGLVAAAAGGWVFLRLYQSPRLYDQYLKPMHSFLSAALAGDSTALVGTGASMQAIDWGLRVRRENPRALGELNRGLGASWGGPTRRPIGDSLLVLFRGPRNGVCYATPILVTFAGPPSTARVLTVTAECLGRKTNR